ncbi:MAG: TIGR02647 family protein [Gammaproteobacteria bacterium]|nr:TIGR02647 family protein [Gammaproteobacteria bacterium]MDH5778605.1 TIGR02647 family protein [Gammaproteobacteria bacterium]
MSIAQERVDELNLLLQFNMNSLQEGIKVHTSAETSVINAAQRLFDKGLLTQVDGGYLTDLGMEAAEMADKLLRIIADT